MLFVGIYYLKVLVYTFYSFSIQGFALGCIKYHFNEKKFKYCSSQTPSDLIANQTSLLCLNIGTYTLQGLGLNVYTSQIVEKTVIITTKLT